jgi:hypothetical protein
MWPHLFKGKTTTNQPGSYRLNRKVKMKTPSSHPNRPLRAGGIIPALLLTAVLSLGAVLSAFAGEGKNTGNPGVLPPQSHPYGKTYGEWAAAWWQWVMSIPADRNPLTDPTGEFAGENQGGPVWFAAGTFGDSVERSFAVPAGKAIFIPVDNWIFGAGAFDCDPSVPGVPCVVCDLRDLAAANTEAAEILEVSIDGVPLRNPRQYRASSPEPFGIVYPENSVVGLPAGTYSPNVADGYWLMLAPLAKGTHEICIYVLAPETSYGLIEFEVTLHIEVAAQP